MNDIVLISNSKYGVSPQEFEVREKLTSTDLYAGYW